MKLIGLTGPAGSGKSTVARLLSDRHGYIELSFAEPLRRFCAELTGLREEQLQQVKEYPHPALCGRTPREFMQRLGTEFGRDMIGDDLWIRFLEHRMTLMRDWTFRGERGFVISDCRFANEAQWIRSKGVLWHLTRPGHQIHQHRSECGVEFTEGDRLLNNDCDLAQLAERIARIFE